MSKIFEDVFVDAQASIISLCRELTQDRVDVIYAYCSIEDGSYAFNAFFTANGKVMTLRELDVDMETKRAFLRLGVQDTRQIKKVCDEYGKPTPTEIKMVYDVKTRKFDAEYQYKPVQTMDIGFHDLYMKWIAEIDPTYPL